MPFIEMEEKKFSRWTVIHRSKKTKSGAYWLCRCECGTEKEVNGYTLRKGLTQSCGCLAAELASQREYRPQVVPIKDRFSRYVKPVASGCHEWTGAVLKSRNGYGVININGKATPAHRVAYELAFGATPSGMFVCHKCDNPPCVNPDHLFLGSAIDNNRDAAVKGRNIKGEHHPFAKLSKEDVIEIYQSKDRPCDLARKYGVAPSAVNRIKTGKSWASVTKHKSKAGGLMGA